jgi:hypothetical protein
MPSDTSSIGNLSSIYKNIPTVITLKVNHICNNGSISSIQKLPLLGTILTAVGKIKQAFYRLVNLRILVFNYNS